MVWDNYDRPASGFNEVFLSMDSRPRKSEVLAHQAMMGLLVTRNALIEAGCSESMNSGSLFVVLCKKQTKICIIPPAHGFDFLKTYASRI